MPYGVLGNVYPVCRTPHMCTPSPKLPSLLTSTQCWRWYGHEQSPSTQCPGHTHTETSRLRRLLSCTIANPKQETSPNCDSAPWVGSSQACRRPEPEEKLLFPICDSTPRDTGDPSKSALGAVRTGITLPPSAGIYFWRKYFFQQSFRQVLPFQVVPIGGGDRCEGTSNTRQPPRTRRWQERRPWPARLRSQQPGQDHQWRELP